ncbi:MAG: hypothetical protein RR769_05285 [Anaerovoracaceae bacterium]
MNQDFHYNGTYCAAMLAGFERKEAELIAWAAQMVDEYTMDMAKEQGIQTDGKTITCESLGDNASDDMHWLSTSTNPTLQKVRNIWMPFHFLPGNLDMKCEYKGEKSWGAYKFNDRDEQDFRCMCIPNSELAKNMINDTKDNYTDATEAVKHELLYLIGIRMHVLADTWAHQYFVGSPSYWVNEVSKLDKRVKKEVSINENRSTIGISNYSILYLGHGRAGHYPDYGFLQFEYNPRFADPRNMIHRNNQVDFFEAFFQMVEAMQCIKTGQEFTFKTYNNIQGNMPRNITKQIQDEIQKVLNTQQLDQTPAWVEFMNQVIHKSEPVVLPIFDKKSNDFSQFDNEAGKQRNLVRDYLNKNQIY